MSAQGGQTSETNLQVAIVACGCMTPRDHVYLNVLVAALIVCVSVVSREVFQSIFFYTQNKTVIYIRIKA